ncbi:MAG: hypothetical protein H0T73_17170 [Ardenticatenales bacterium]|nr:hypothetical protein [Ardenticatenales bacterium]
MPSTMRLFLAILLLSMLAAGCQRGGTGEEVLPTLEPLLSEIPPSPTLEGFVLPGEVLPIETPVPFPLETPTPGLGLPLPITPEATAGRFSTLRFAATTTGFEQATFPEGTEEVYAIWDYDGMKAGDTMTRVWYHNGTQYVERDEEWDILKYGFNGTVRDVFIYDYEGGLFAGQWRVELYLNGVQQVTGEFTVGAP